MSSDYDSHYILEPKKADQGKSYKRKISQAQLSKTNRMEVVEDDSGFKSMAG